MKKKRKKQRAKKTKPLKWRPMDESAARKLTNVTLSPNVVYPVQLPVSAAPSNFRDMPGAVSYYASNFLSPVLSKGVTVDGEFVVARTDGDLVKAYNYMMATSSNGSVYYSGPYKDFPAHHIQMSSPVIVSNLFGHSPAGKSRSPQ
jgi:hypothetical protein